MRWMTSLFFEQSSDECRSQLDILPQLFTLSKLLIKALISIIRFSPIIPLEWGKQSLGLEHGLIRCFKQFRTMALHSHTVGPCLEQHHPSDLHDSTRSVDMKALAYRHLQWHFSGRLLRRIAAASSVSPQILFQLLGRLHALCLYRNDLSYRPWM